MSIHLPRRATFALLVLAAAAAVAVAKDIKAELREDLKDLGVVGDWIYDDIDAGFARAAKEKKPLCVVFR